MAKKLANAPVEEIPDAIMQAARTALMEAILSSLSSKSFDAEAGVRKVANAIIDERDRQSARITQLETALMKVSRLVGPKGSYPCIEANAIIRNALV